ncbi:hypothetical protein ACFU8W_27875 [Streptomyces sp. NPDC057565]|uniref:hypothetical protein n=1 Tax=Streptomyces sp. NPDC057565 TaxID=3346169 RepID=UPI00369EABCC
MSAHLSQTDPAGATDGLARRLLTALVCSAVEPRLSGVLLFDLPADSIASVTRMFASLLARSTGGTDGAEVPRTVLGAATQDQELWVRPRLRSGPGGIAFTLAPGPLTEAEAVPPLVVVPDLARLSVPGMRAAVQLLGTDVATVEHSGLRRQWSPRARWFAICRAEDVERVSPHLLDRFPVRLSVAGLRTPPGPEPFGRLPAPWEAALEPVEHRTPVRLGDGLAARVLELLGEGDGTGHRRALALTRIARALARLDGADEVTADRADEAARLIGLPSARRPPAGRERSTGPTDVKSAVPGPGVRRPLHPPEPGPEGRRRPLHGTPVLEPGPAEPIGPAPAAGTWAADTPYPEDTTSPTPESMSLHIQARRTAGPRTARGAVIGVRRARDLWDLAPVRTVMEAAKYQAIRGRPERLLIAPGDLRGYVRAPEPERMLALVLDHTCRDGWDWHDALEPFLHWAYVSRASVQVVEVGGRAAAPGSGPAGQACAHELRAESFAARSVLDPRLTAALNRAPGGRATPLAHGLEQAAQALRRAFQHHRAGLVEALLVVVTDGRGNVPLAVSHLGRPGTSAVGRTGIDDALAVATRISGMDRTRLHSVVVDPVRQPYAELPSLLSDALGGTVIDGRPVEEATDHAW